MDLTRKKEIDKQKKRKGGDIIRTDFLRRSIEHTNHLDEYIYMYSSYR
jgi:hypothetical protein